MTNGSFTITMQSPTTVSELIKMYLKYPEYRKIIGDPEDLRKYYLSNTESIKLDTRLMPIKDDLFEYSDIFNVMSQEEKILHGYVVRSLTAEYYSYWYSSGKDVFGERGFISPNMVSFLATNFRDFLKYPFIVLIIKYRGIDVHQNIDGFPVIFYAADYCNSELVNYILHKGGIYDVMCYIHGSIICNDWLARYNGKHIFHFIKNIRSALQFHFDVYLFLALKSEFNNIDEKLINRYVEVWDSMRGHKFVDFNEIKCLCSTCVARLGNIGATCTWDMKNFRNNITQNSKYRQDSPKSDGSVGARDGSVGVRGESVGVRGESIRQNSSGDSIDKVVSVGTKFLEIYSAIPDPSIKLSIMNMLYTDIAKDIFQNLTLEEKINLSKFVAKSNFDCNQI